MDNNTQSTKNSKNSKKWIIIQSAGEHLPNKFLRECLALQHALIQNGQQADVWGPRHEGYDPHQIPDWESYDFVLVIENYELGFLPNFNNIHKPLKLQWIIDLHCKGPTSYLPISRQMDVILHSTKSLIPGYRKSLSDDKITHLWFPNGVDDRYFKVFPEQTPLEKIHSLTFIGNLNNRKDYVNRLKNEARLGSEGTDNQLEYFFRIGEEMFQTVRQTKVNFNKSIGCDVNYRNFETIGLGTCLCTNYMAELEELGFKDGVNCLMYRTYEECVQKIKDVLGEENDAKREAIARTGAEFAKAHSYTQRIATLISAIKFLGK